MRGEKREVRRVEREERREKREMPLSILMRIFISFTHIDSQMRCKSNCVCWESISPSSISRYLFSSPLSLLPLSLLSLLFSCRHPFHLSYPLRTRTKPSTGEENFTITRDLPSPCSMSISAREEALDRCRGFTLFSLLSLPSLSIFYFFSPLFFSCLSSLVFLLSTPSSLHALFSA